MPFLDSLYTSYMRMRTAAAAAAGAAAAACAAFLHAHVRPDAQRKNGTLPSQDHVQKGLKQITDLLVDVHVRSDLTAKGR